MIILDKPRPWLPYDLVSYHTMEAVRWKLINSNEANAASWWADQKKMVQERFADPENCDIQGDEPAEIYLFWNRDSNGIFREGCPESLAENLTVRARWDYTRRAK